jgi:tetratricopeptide (TPR) repeat protein
MRGGILLLLVWSASAWAAPPQAKGLYLRAEAAYALGKFDEAATLFEKAYEQSHNPNVLFDIAQSYRLQSEQTSDLALLRRALVVYQSYLRAAPTGSKRPVAEKFLSQIQAKLSQPASAQPPPPPPPVIYNPLVAASRLSICVDDASAWHYCDSRNKTLSENDFIRRYHQVTASPELDQFIESPANKTGLIAVGAVGAGLLAMALGGTGGLFAPGNSYSNPNINAAVTFTIFGWVGFGLDMIIGWPLAVRQPKSHHRLGQAEAQQRIDRYNAALSAPRGP